jgi:hypothetical protein
MKKFRKTTIWIFGLQFVSMAFILRVSVIFTETDFVPKILERKVWSS